MNIVKKDLQTGLKPFLFWLMGLFVIVYGGAVKFTGVSAGGEGVSAIMDSLPRIVQAIFGVAGIDIGKFNGYYAALVQYVFILVAIYSVYLGNNAVSREMTDRTYEFLFTKPRSRSYILKRKLIPAITYLSLYCALFFIFSVSATSTLKLADVSSLVAMQFLFSIAAWLIGLSFFSVATLFSAAAQNPERGAKFSNLSVLAAFGAGVCSDIAENGALFRFLSPFKYFSAAEIINGHLNLFFAILCASISFAALFWAFRLFEKKDLSSR